ncbi:hypothetical protein D3C76_920590 [compost metagenome]
MKCSPATRIFVATCCCTTTSSRTRKSSACCASGSRTTNRATPAPTCPMTSTGWSISSSTACPGWTTRPAGSKPWKACTAPISAITSPVSTRTASSSTVSTTASCKAAIRCTTRCTCGPSRTCPTSSSPPSVTAWRWPTASKAGYRCWTTTWSSWPARCQCG